MTQRSLRSVRSFTCSTTTILPVPCNVGVPGAIPGGGTSKGERDVDVRIGIVQTAKELEIELEEDADRSAIMADIEAALSNETVLWLTDRKGRRVAVPAAKVAYVEVGAPSSDRRVGFGAP